MRYLVCTQLSICLYVVLLAGLERLLLDLDSVLVRVVSLLSRRAGNFVILSKHLPECWACILT